MTESIAQLQGMALLAVVCLLLTVEEFGVPMPFAPGDLLLAVVGIAIATGELHPVVGIGASLLSVIAGALAGRELFAAAGQRILRRLYGDELPGPLERAAGILRRGGWWAVMLARLTPGLRIHTTQLAGVLGLPRRVFVAGLVPASAIYCGVFVGLGMLFGESVVRLVLDTVHRGGMALFVLVVSVVVAIALYVALKRRLEVVRGGRHVRRTARVESEAAAPDARPRSGDLR